MDTPGAAPPFKRQSPAPADTLGRLVRLMRKELREILRDRRTILTLVLMPLLLYPLLFVGFRQFFLANAAAADRHVVYQIGFPTLQDRDDLQWFLSRAEGAGEDREASEATPGQVPAPTRVQFVVVDDLETAVSAGKLDVGIRLHRPDPAALPRAPRTRNLALDCDLLFVQQSGYGRDALNYLQGRLAVANERFLEKRLRELEVSQRPVPVKVVSRALPAVEKKSSETLAVLVPLVLILMTITGAVYPAIDLTAGERERGTLEILVAAPIPRVGLLGAKYVAVLTVAILTALVNLGMMTLTLQANGLGGMFGTGGLSASTVVSVLGLLFLYAAFFSAVLLAITSFARSFKEAQAFIIPLMLASIAPGLLSMVPSFKLTGPRSVVPLINIVLLSRDLFLGTADVMLAAVVVVSTLLYALAAIAVAARIFGAEAVLYSDQAGWADLFQRPERPRSAPSVPGSLFCLALMFPAQFLLTSTVAQLPDLTLGMRLLLGAVATAVLFAGVPAAAAGLGRVRLETSFRLAPPRSAALAAAALLGVSLWPFAHAFLTALQEWGFTTLPDNYQELVRQNMQKLRELSPVAIVATLAVVPAVCEELFFRGFLYSALRNQVGPRQTVLGTAILFGLFHLITGEAFAVERLATTTFLGLVLGWVCWKTASVVPGMVLHGCHNGCLVLLAYYKEELVERGWISGEDQLPAAVFLGAAVGVCLGAALIQFGSRFIRSAGPK
jgi:ABC-2 type transport system permease protein/sodium transport system permease protein